MKGAHWQGQLRLALVKVLLRLFSWLPLRLNHQLGGLIGWLAWRVNGRMARISRENIRRCLPQWPTDEQEKLVRDSLIETGKAITEAGPLWLWPEERILPLVKEIRGREHLDQAMQSGRGAILLGPHLGAWELGGLYSDRLYPATILYRSPRQPELESLMVEARSRFGAQLVPANTRGVRALLTALRQQQLVAILPDQEPRFGQGVFAPFFGHPAYTLTLVASLLRKTGAKAVYGFMERLPRGQGYRLHYLPAPDGLDAEDPVEAATALNRGVENCVRRLPAQYQWSYRRFRTRPAKTALHHEA